MARTSFALLMLAIAGSSALALGVVGIFGVISYTVAQRTREIGIRATLGARPAELQRMFVRHGLTLAAIGVTCGLAAAVLLTRFMRSLLFAIDPLDPATYAAATALLVAAAAFASFVPAQRATAVDPAQDLSATSDWSYRGTRADASSYPASANRAGIGAEELLQSRAMRTLRRVWRCRARADPSGLGASRLRHRERAVRPLRRRARHAVAGRSVDAVHGRERDGGGVSRERRGDADGRFVREAGIASAALMLGWMLILRLPGAIAGPAWSGDWTNVLKAAHARVRRDWRGRRRRPADRRGAEDAAHDRAVRDGRVLPALPAFSTSCSPASWQTLVPRFIPGALFWTYFAAVALLAAGIGFCVPPIRP